MYTDTVEFGCSDEVHDLYDLANEFVVEELVDKCHKYLLKDKLTVKNLFSKYELALKKKDGGLLESCRNFACSMTQYILKSEDFLTAPSNVIKDIVKQDNLLLNSELEIIMAVIRRGREDLRKKSVSCNDMHLRDSVNPFVKYLRFLTLTESEFQYLVENHNIFSAHESIILLRKILQPDSDINVPENICSITVKRKSLRRHSTVPESVETPATRLSNEIKKCALTQESKASFPKFKQTEFRSSPDISKKILHKTSFPSSSMLTTPQSSFRIYSFPLNEINPSVFTTFSSEIQSHVTLKMKSGNILLCGIELKIMNNTSKTDKVNVFVDLQGFSQPLSQMYPKELCNNCLTIQFNKNMILKQGCKGNLEVSIHNLNLNRCFSCDIQEFELNNGLEFECELSLKSNKKCGNGFYFLISKLLYALVK